MAARVDLNGIKTQIKTVLDSANTTTASPIDLSSSLTSRVQRVLTVHPDFIKPQASFYPLVTCYISGKTIENMDIAIDQLNSKRRAIVNIDVVGAVFNQNMLSVDADPADNDINYLMENVELALRASPNLASNVKWQVTDGVTYFSAIVSQNAAIRAGVLSLKATVLY